jgi:hypothetical protein
MNLQNSSLPCTDGDAPPQKLGLLMAIVSIAARAMR